MITVFTPTYNRAALLPRLYESLLTQTSTDFEWVVVDDGSSDHTATLIQGYMNDARLAIHYHKQENAGKHVAINTGVQLATRPYFFIVDSDDYLPATSIEKLQELITEAQDLPDCGGVSGTMLTPNLNSVGTDSFQPIYTNAIDIRYIHHIKGDLAEVFKTAVLKEFPFPQISGETFCPEIVVWHRIAKIYKLYYTDMPLYIRDYQKDGLTGNIVKIRMNSPKATMIAYSELITHKIPFTQKQRAAINFWRFAFNSDIPFNQKFVKVPFVFNIVGLPLGLLMHKRDVNNISGIR